MAVMRRPTRNMLLALAVCAGLFAGCSREAANETAGPGQDASGAAPESRRLARGEAIYKRQCAACHQASGQGLPSVFPPLAGSDFIANNRRQSIEALLFGLAGPITVNGVDYNGVMPSFGHLSDADLSAVLSYVFTSWGNAVEPVDVDEVAAVRATRSR